jgi:hypothetical protein
MQLQTPLHTQPCAERLPSRAEFRKPAATSITDRLRFALVSRRRGRLNLSIMCTAPEPEQSEPQQAHAVPRSDRRRRLVKRTPHLYRSCDQATGGLLYGLIVFSPWAFGSTEQWTVWVMNGAGYALGALLLAKWFKRWTTGYTPERWGKPRRGWPTWLLASLTLLLLAWMLASAINRRATMHYVSGATELAYRDPYIAWLPHSYHAPATWFEFWRALGLACTFWAARDWLLGKTRRERLHHGEEADSEETGWEPELVTPEGPPRLPTRLRRLLWVLCLNASFLALEGILQRLDGTNRLLWLVVPHYNRTAESQFGPYAYRSNAAQYLNMIWPVCLGLWWVLRQETRRSTATNRVGGKPHCLLLPCAVLIAAAPVFSLSRGAILITLGLAPLVALVLLLAGWHHRPKWAWVVPLAVAVGFTALTALAWPAVKSRLYGLRRAYQIPGVTSLEAFTLRWVLKVPERPPTAAVPLVGFSGSEDGWYGLPPSLAFMLAPSGTLDLVFFGPNWEVYRWTLAPRLVAEHAGQVADLVVRRATNLVCYLNGLAIATNADSEASLWLTNAVAAGYLRVAPASPVLAAPPNLVSVYDRPLAAPEILELHERLADGQDKAIPPAAVGGPLATLTYEQIHTPGLLLDQVSGRRETYAVSRRMAADALWLGFGPGTFGWLYGLYRPSGTEPWAWYAHNDWLETLITFGRVGLALVILALITALTAGLFAGGLPLPGTFLGLVWVSLAGCLIHARYDFPFQVHSVTWLFLLLACLTFIGSPRPKPAIDH